MYTTCLSEMLGGNCGMKSKFTNLKWSFVLGRQSRYHTLKTIYKISKESTMPLCMVEMVTHNAGVVSLSIYLHVMWNAGPVSTSENV